MDQRKADGFQVRRKDREEGDQQRQHHIAFPKALQARNDRDFREPEKREQARPQQRCKPRNGEKDEEGEVGEAEDVRAHLINRQLKHSINNTRDEK